MPEQFTSLPHDKQYHGSFKQLADARRVLKIAAKLNGHPVLPAEQRLALAQIRVAAELVIADAVEPKICQSSRPDFPWAVAITCAGPGQAVRLPRLETARNVMELCGQLQPAIAEFKQRSRFAGHAPAAMRLLAVAWDRDVGAPRIFAAGDGLEQFKPSWWLPPGVTEMDQFFGCDVDLSYVWGGGSPNDPAQFDKGADAIAVFDERRSQAYRPIGGGPIGHYVGGELQMAEVSEHGVTGFTLHDWRDRVGARIAPAIVADAVA